MKVKLSFDVPDHTSTHVAYLLSKLKSVSENWQLRVSGGGPQLSWDEGKLSEFAGDASSLQSNHKTSPAQVRRKHPSPAVFRLTGKESEDYLSKLVTRIEKWVFDADNEECALGDITLSITRCLLAPTAGQAGTLPSSLIALVTRFHPTIQKHIVESLTSTTLQCLRIERPPNTSRVEYFAHAALFASLVANDMFSSSAAAAVIVDLLRLPGTRTAGVTALGKLVEIGAEGFTTTCDRTALLSLRKSVEMLPQDLYEYDALYILNNVDWPESDYESQGLDDSPVTESPEEPPKLHFEHYLSVKEHTHLVSAVTSIRHRDDMRVISACKGGKVALWDSDCNLEQKIQVPNHYLCSVATSSQSLTLYGCGIPKVSSRRTSLISVSLSSQLKFGEICVTKQTAMDLLSCVAVSGSSVLVGGVKSSQNVLCLHEEGRQGRIPRWNPVRIYEGHTDLVTGIYAMGGTNFLSVSRDKSIRQWDMRQADCAYFVPLSHQNMITGVTGNADGLIATSDISDVIKLWDERMLGSDRPLAEWRSSAGGTMQVAMNGRCIVSVGLKGLYMVEVDEVARDPVRFQFSPIEVRNGSSVYHDVIWLGNSVCAAENAGALHIFKPSM